VTEFSIDSAELSANSADNSTKFRSSKISLIFCMSTTFGPNFLGFQRFFSNFSKYDFSVNGEFCNTAHDSNVCFRQAASRLAPLPARGQTLMHRVPHHCAPASDRCIYGPAARQRRVCLHKVPFQRRLRIGFSVSWVEDLNDHLPGRSLFV
jgi:hypothetical protein